jgi:hypothetical protein
MFVLIFMHTFLCTQLRNLPVVGWLACHKLWQLTAFSSLEVTHE